MIGDANTENTRLTSASSWHIGRAIARNQVAPSNYGSLDSVPVHLVHDPDARTVYLQHRSRWLTEHRANRTWKNWHIAISSVFTVISMIAIWIMISNDKWGSNTTANGWGSMGLMAAGLASSVPMGVFISYAGCQARRQMQLEAQLRGEYANFTSSVPLPVLVIHNQVCQPQVEIHTEF